MPRLSEVRVEALRDLVDQLRYAPPASAARHVDRAEALAVEIDPDQTYPLEWILYRLTDYRSEELTGLVTGEALLRDLSAVVERLCANARLTAGHLPEHVTQDNLCERWGVSRKTLERYRRRGLIARRASIDGGTRVLVAFSLSTVERFEREHPELLERAGRFTRLDETGAKRLVRRVLRYQRSLGWNRTRAIQRLAERTGRTAEGIRYLVHRHAPAQDADGDGPDDAALLEAWRRGATPAELAELAGRPATTAMARVHRERVQRARRALQRSTDAHHPAKRSADAAGDLLDDPAVRTGLEWGIGAEGSTLMPLDELLDAAAVRVVPVGAQEVLMGRARRALLSRASDLLAKDRLSAPALDRVETDLRWATLLKATLARPMLHVAHAQVHDVLGDRADLLTGRQRRSLLEASLSAMGAALDRWDPESSGRPAGAVTIAVSRAAARWLAANPPPDRPSSSARAIESQQRAVAWAGGLDAWQAWLSLPITPDHPGLRAEQRSWLKARFGLAGEAPMTAEELAGRLGVESRAVERRCRSALRLVRASD